MGALASRLYYMKPIHAGENQAIDKRFMAKGRKNVLVQCDLGASEQVCISPFLVFSSPFVAAFRTDAAQPCIPLA
jgi:hypothetical protein